MSTPPSYLCAALSETRDPSTRSAKLDELQRHLNATSPKSLEFLVKVHRCDPVAQLRAIARAQLDGFARLADHIEDLEVAVRSGEIEVRKRAALSGLLCSLTGAPEEAVGERASPTVLLQPAFVFYACFLELRAWLPTQLTGPARDAASTQHLETSPPRLTLLELLRLGIPDYLRPILDGRADGLRTRFHAVRSCEPGCEAELLELIEARAPIEDFPQAAMPVAERVRSKAFPWVIPRTWSDSGIVG